MGLFEGEESYMGLREMVTQFIKRKRALDDEYEQLLNELVETASDLSRRMGKLESTVSGFKTTVQGIEESVRVLSEQSANQRTDISDHTYLKHDDIAKQFDAFVDQDIVVAAGNIIRTPRREAAEFVRDEAVIVSILTRLFFSEECVSARKDQAGRQGYLKRQGVELEVSEVDRLSKKAHRICVLADKTGHSPQWRFSCNRGSLIDEQEQQPWNICDRHSSVEFVVAPAYVAFRADKPITYAKQRVFTAILTPS